MALNYQFLGRKIQQKRMEMKISQLKFAELIDTSSAFVSRMERGEKGPSLETLVLIADVLDTSIDALLADNRVYVQNGYAAELIETMKDCSAYERFVLLRCLKETKRILREGEPMHKQDR